MLRTVLLVSVLLAGSLGARADTRQDCVQEEDHELRIRACTAVIAGGGKISWAIFNRGLSYNKTKRQELALADFTRYIRLLPKDPTGYNDRGNAYLRLHKDDLAIKDYQRAIELDPKYALARNNIGEAYENLNQLDQALASYNKAIEINPGYARAYSNRGDIYRKKSDLDLAISNYGRAIGIEPTSARYYARGRIFLQKNDFSGAIQDYARAIESDPQNADLYNSRAWAYLKWGKPAEGLPDAEKSLALRPNDAHALDTRGSIFEALQRKEEAIADFRRALSVDAGLQNSRDGLIRLGATP